MTANSPILIDLESDEQKPWTENVTAKYVLNAREANDLLLLGRNSTLYFPYEVTGDRRYPLKAFPGEQCIGVFAYTPYFSPSHILLALFYTPEEFSMDPRKIRMEPLTMTHSLGKWEGKYDVTVLAKERMLTMALLNVLEDIKEDRPIYDNVDENRVGVHSLLSIFHRERTYGAYYYKCIRSPFYILFVFYTSRSFPTSWKQVRIEPTRIYWDDPKYLDFPLLPLAPTFADAVDAMLEAKIHPYRTPVEWEEETGSDLQNSVEEIAPPAAVNTTKPPGSKVKKSSKKPSILDKLRKKFRK